MPRSYLPITIVPKTTIMQNREVDRPSGSIASSKGASVDDDRFPDFRRVTPQ